MMGWPMGILWTEIEKECGVVFGKARRQCPVLYFEDDVVANENVMKGKSVRASQ